MLPDLEHLHLLRPAWLLLLLPWLGIIVLAGKRLAKKDMFGGIIAPHLLEHLRLTPGNARWFNPTSFGIAFIVLMMIIVLGPSWRQQPSPLAQDDSALVLLLDVSSSMEQTDVQPSRLARAKQKASDLLALRPDKQSSLLVYAGTAHTVLTLTADQEILNQYLAALDPGMMPRPGKFPEYALPLIDDVLRDSTAAATVVLMTDGLGTDSRRAFADYFDQRPHQLLVLGVGTEESGDGMVPLDRGGLEALADAAGGRYLSLTIDDGDVRALERRIDSHYVIIDNDALPWLDSGYPLVFPCLAIFLMWFRKGWTLTWSWLLLPLVLAGAPGPALAQDEAAPAPAARLAPLQWFADLWLTPDQQGRLLLQRGNYAGAAAHFQDPLWKGIAHYYNCLLYTSPSPRDA